MLNDMQRRKLFAVYLPTASDFRQFTINDHYSMPKNSRPPIGRKEEKKRSEFGFPIEKEYLVRVSLGQKVDMKSSRHYERSGRGGGAKDKHNKSNYHHHHHHTNQNRTEKS